MSDRRPVVHFLHIGKTAGTALGWSMTQLNDNPASPFRFVKHPHNTLLRHLPSRAPYFFAVRDPEARFYSGFYSRKRKGQPRYFYEWTEAEAEAFGRFPEATDLAEALFSGGDAGAAAERAMRSIRHVNSRHLDWFAPDPERIFTTRPPVFILRQKSLAADFARLLGRLEVPVETRLPARSDSAHRNDYDRTPPLSDKARANLAEWYRDDIAFVRQAEEWALKHEVY